MQWTEEQLLNSEKNYYRKHNIVVEPYREYDEKQNYSRCYGGETALWSYLTSFICAPIITAKDSYKISCANWAKLFTTYTSPWW